MNFIIIIAIVLIIAAISHEPKAERTGKRFERHKQMRRDAARIDSLTHRVSVLEEVLLDRERQLRGKFRDL
ncbi:MAG: hypothetical protein ABJG15_15065 [Hyphomonadaceae bacterium]